MTTLDAYIAALAAYNHARSLVDVAHADYQAAMKRHQGAAGESVAAMDKLKAARAQWETEVMAGPEAFK